MEKPNFPLPRGDLYLVTGARAKSAVLTIHPARGKDGDRRWEATTARRCTT